MRTYPLSVAPGVTLRSLVALFAIMVFAQSPASAGAWRGDYFPNVILTDQDGKEYRFYDDLLKDKIVTINFMYTSCKDVCPLDTAQLLRVQELISDRVGKSVHMYSITIDPEVDTPEALKKYAYTYGVKPGWKFFTGKKEDIELIAKKLAIRTVTPGKPRDHDTSVMLANEKLGQWIKRSVFDDPKVLANLLTDTLTNFDVGIAGTSQAFEVAPRINIKSRGDYLFKTRCQSCHTIGGGDRLGPDLANVVASRPREWLTRWIKEPDKMIEEGDPIATELKARYRNLPMPNFGFTDVEVKSLIEYMAEMDAIRNGTAPAEKPVTKKPKKAKHHQ